MRSFGGPDLLPVGVPEALAVGVLKIKTKIPRFIWHVLGVTLVVAPQDPALAIKNPVFIPVYAVVVPKDLAVKSQLILRRPTRGYR